MAATQCRICVLIATGALRQITVPDADSQLTDPAFSPADSICVNIPLSTYSSLTKISTTLTAVQPAVALIDSGVGILVTAAAVVAAALGR